MGFLARFKRRSRHPEAQADTLDPEKLRIELIEAKANLAYLKNVPLSYFKGPTINNGTFTQYSVDKSDEAIGYAEAEVARLQAKLKGSGLRLVRLDTKEEP